MGEKEQKEALTIEIYYMRAEVVKMQRIFAGKIVSQTLLSDT